MDKQKRIEKLKKELEKIDSGSLDSKKIIRKFTLQRLIKKLEE